MRRFAKSFKGIPSRTKVSFAGEADINNIMRRYAKTGALPVSAVRPRYLDSSAVEDYFQAQLVLKEAEKALQRLPAAVRSRFGSNPEALLRFVGDEKNKEEAQKLGLLAASVDGQEDAPKKSEGEKATGSAATGAKSP